MYKHSFLDPLFQSTLQPFTIKISNVDFLQSKLFELKFHTNILDFNYLRILLRLTTKTVQKKSLSWNNIKWHTQKDEFARREFGFCIYFLNYKKEKVQYTSYTLEKDVFQINVWCYEIFLQFFAYFLFSYLKYV